jgi:hypothetical protein
MVFYLQDSWCGWDLWEKLCCVNNSISNSCKEQFSTKEYFCNIEKRGIVEYCALVVN